MLVVSRKMDNSPQSRIVIQTSDGPIVIEALCIKSGLNIKIGVSAPDNCVIWREELLASLDKQPPLLQPCA
jgi:sRNA-binding carbon storage regulator CsrA